MVAALHYTADNARDMPPAPTRGLGGPRVVERVRLTRNQARLAAAGQH